MTDCLIQRDDALGPDALGLIAGSERELASLYAPEHRYAFSPDQLRSADTRFLVGYLGSEPATCGGIAMMNGYAELKRIFTAPGHRGKGLAAQIVTALESEALDQGVNIVRLETGLASPEAIRLYEKLGYAHRGPFGGYEDNGSSVFMEKRLNADPAGAEA